MKKAWFFVLAILLNASLLMAQWPDRGGPGGGQPPSPEMRAQRSVDRLIEQLQLPAEKKDQLVAAFVTYYETQQKARAEQNMDMMQTAIGTRDTKVKEILANEEQYTAYQKYMEEERARMMSRMGQGPPPGGPPAGPLPTDSTKVKSQKQGKKKDKKN